MSSSSIANETVDHARERKPLSIMAVLTNVYFLYTVSLVGFFLTWDRVAANQVFGDSLARPIEVANQMLLLTKVKFGGTNLWGHIWASTQRVLIGFGLAAIVAVPLGLFMAINKYVNALVKPVFDLFKPMPPIAWVSLAILWFGIGESSKLIIVILATFFPIFLNTLAAISRPNAGLLELAQVFRLSPGAAFWHLRLPMAMPAIYTGLRIGLGYSWRSLIGAEMIAAAAGLGWLILDGEEMARPDVVLAGIFVLGLLGILTDAAIRALGRRCWRFTGGE